jgi:hypothetical protein
MSFNNREVQSMFLTSIGASSTWGTCWTSSAKKEGSTSTIAAQKLQSARTALHKRQACSGLEDLAITPLLPFRWHAHAWPSSARRATFPHRRLFSKLVLSSDCDVDGCVEDLVHAAHLLG